MKTLRLIPLTVFLGSLVLHKPAQAQNIRGDTIYVNANSKVAIVFPSAPSRAELSIKDGSYEVDDFGKTALSVKASKRNAKEQTLEVTEGRRKHLFVLLFREEVPTLRKDYSNLRKLKAYAEQQKKITAKALAEANTLFDQQLWEKARAQYQQLVYTVEGKDADLVNTRLREIGNQLQIITEKKYKNAMDLGMTYGKAGKYAEAKQSFEEALKYKPGDEHALKNIRFIEQKWFEDLVKKGDEANAKKNYVLAKGYYQEAMPMKSNDPVIQSKFNQVKKKADPLIYLIMKNKGDSAYEENNLLEARKCYDSALAVKPNDAYAKAQVNKIIKLEEYNSIVDKANSLAAAATTVQQYDLAIVEYRKALVLFPNRDYPKDQVKELILKRDSLVRKSSTGKN